MPALADFAGSVRAWGGLVANRRLTSPKENLGAWLTFADGSSSFVFRETAMSEAPTSDPTLLVIQFRLAALGSNAVLHAAFRRECALHTPLFAGFPGFRSKLWIDDVETGVYVDVHDRAAVERRVRAAHRFAHPRGVARAKEGGQSVELERAGVDLGWH